MADDPKAVADRLGEFVAAAGRVPKPLQRPSERPSWALAKSRRG